jgi:choline dehydrogenase
VAFDDIYSAGIASGWKVRDGARLRGNLRLEADVVIVGTGAGGGTAAEILSAAGLKVLMLEEGPLRNASSFKDMDDLRAMRDLYQEASGRSTADGAVSILQGRCVGGSTTVNWTTCFRTPPQTLQHWAQAHGVKGAGVADMAPWFEKMETRLGIAPWGTDPNANNAVLKRGCDALGWEAQVLRRNVRGCWNSGYCGLGCPTNAKQSMLVSTIPQALRNGAELVHSLRVQRLHHQRGRVVGLTAVALGEDTVTPTGATVEVSARHYLLAGGALNTPALLLRSGAPDPYRRVGMHTCIHPVNASYADMPEVVNPFYGAPQSIASDEFQWKHDTSQQPGFIMEVAPLFPAMSSGIFGLYGTALTQLMARFDHAQATIALLRDGFHDESPGGAIRVDDSGMPVLDYAFTDYVWRGFKKAFLSMAELQFAAGAKQVMPLHLDAAPCSSWSAARKMIEDLPYRTLRTQIFSAHLMGGCAMGDDPKRSVTDSDGSHHQLENLTVCDGSLFPTSIGANPQLSVYGFAAKHATRLASALGGKPEQAAAAAG